MVGPDVLPDTQRLILETCTMFKNAFLQQSAFDEIDTYTVAQKQVRMLRIILAFYYKGLQALRKGAYLMQLKRLTAYQDIMKMKFSIANDQLAKLDKLLEDLEKEMRVL